MFYVLFDKVISLETKRNYLYYQIHEDFPALTFNLLLVDEKKKVEKKNYFEKNKKKKN